MVECCDQLVGQMLLHDLVAWRGKAYHIRCKEGGDDRNRHDHRIQELANDAQRQSQRGDDERELAYLSHGEAASHGRLERLTAQHETKGSQYSLTYQDGEHEGKDRQGIVDQDLWINQHTHRHKEDGSEEVFNRLYQLDDFLCLNGLGKDAAHDEGTESTGESHLGGQHRHAAAESEGHDEKRLAVDEFAHRPEEEWDGKDAHDEPQDEEEDNLDDRLKHLFAVGRASSCDGRKHHHHDNGKNVFQDEHTHHHTGKLLLPQSHVVEGLIDDGGGTHGKHASEEDAVHLVPAESMTHADAQHHHTEHDDDGGDDGRCSHLHDLLEREIESEREQGEDDADVCPGLNVVVVDH